MVGLHSALFGSVELFVQINEIVNEVREKGAAACICRALRRLGAAAVGHG